MGSQAGEVVRLTQQRELGGWGKVSAWAGPPPCGAWGGHGEHDLGGLTHPLLPEDDCRIEALGRAAAGKQKYRSLAFIWHFPCAGFCSKHFKFMCINSSKLPSKEGNCPHFTHEETEAQRADGLAHYAVSDERPESRFKPGEFGRDDGVRPLTTIVATYTH